MPVLLAVTCAEGTAIWLAKALKVLIGPAMYRGGYSRYARNITRL
jgi:hypothetical protein